MRTLCCPREMRVRVRANEQTSLRQQEPDSDPPSAEVPHIQGAFPRPAATEVSVTDSFEGPLGQFVPPLLHPRPPPLLWRPEYSFVAVDMTTTPEAANNSAGNELDSWNRQTFSPFFPALFVSSVCLFYFIKAGFC